MIRAGDAKLLQLGHVVDADGRWRLFAFADEDGIAPNSRLWRLCSFLVDDPESPVRLYTPDGADVDEVIDVRAIVQSTHEEVVSSELPALMRPTKGRIGLIDYEKCSFPTIERGPASLSSEVSAGVQVRWFSFVPISTSLMSFHSMGATNSPPSSPHS